jgi:acetyltransferase-like isoleucine patch superfamily enzyme
MLNMLLTKARYQTPWAGLISSAIANIFPLHYLFRHFFGPHTRSVTLGDTFKWLDPYMVEAGKNVQFGFGCLIIGHVFDNRGLLIRRIKFGNHVVVGGESLIMPGVEMGHHSVLAARSLVPPGTVIKPYEYWAGVPAKKIKDLAPQEQTQAEGD